MEKVTKSCQGVAGIHHHNEETSIGLLNDPVVQLAELVSTSNTEGELKKTRTGIKAFGSTITAKNSVYTDFHHPIHLQQQLARTASCERPEFVESAKSIDLGDYMSTRTGFSSSQNESVLINPSNATNNLAPNRNTNTNGNINSFRTSSTTSLSQFNMMYINHFTYPSEKYAAKMNNTLHELEQQKRELVYVSKFEPTESYSSNAPTNCAPHSALTSNTPEPFLKRIQTQALDKIIKYFLARSKEKKGKEKDSETKPPHLTPVLKSLNELSTEQEKSCLQAAYQAGLVLEDPNIANNLQTAKLDEYKELAWKKKVSIYFRCMFKTKAGAIICTCVAAMILTSLPIFFMIVKSFASSSFRSNTHSISTNQSQNQNPSIETGTATTTTSATTTTATTTLVTGNTTNKTHLAAATDKWDSLWLVVPAFSLWLMLAFMLTFVIKRMNKRVLGVVSEPKDLEDALEDVK